MSSDCTLGGDASVQCFDPIAATPNVAVMLSDAAYLARTSRRAVTPEGSSGGLGGCATKRDGTVWCWGKSYGGRFGTSVSIDGYVDHAVQVQGAIDAVAVEVGWSHICYIDVRGDLYCLGDNTYGQLGQGDQVARLAPTKVPGLTNVNTLTADINTCASIAGGGTYCWGANWHCRNGLGYVEGWPTEYCGDQGSFMASPTLVPGLTSVTGLQAKFPADFAHTCAVRADGTAACAGWIWYDREYWSLASPTFATVAGLSSVVDLVTGPVDITALAADGTLWSAGGRSPSGNEQRATVRPVGWSALAIAADSLLTMFIGTDHEVYRLVKSFDAGAVAFSVEETRVAVVPCN
jgi:alpha-tubulin suppressor-like RCC1 family protein